MGWDRDAHAKAIRDHLKLPPHPITLRLCEQDGLILRPQQLYTFVVDETCARCRELAAISQGVPT